jgi:hypothetical protein
MVGVAALGACRDGGDGAPPAQTVVEAPPTPAPVVALGIPAPMPWNAEDTLVVTLTNGTAAALRGVRVQLWVRGAATLPAPAAGGAVVDSADGGARATWTVAEVAQGTAVELRQAVRTPPAPAPAPGRGAAPPPASVVRAVLLGADGAPLGTPAQDSLRIRPGSEAIAGGCATSRDATAQRYGVGPVRLGMTAAAVRGACPEARDTAWRAEGTPERGLVVSVGGRAVVAQLAGDSVVRVLALAPEVRTPAGVGIGSTVGDLRARYGRLCTAAAEGRIAVWSPTAPGISFGLPPADSGAAPPDSLADAARVASMWIHGQDTPCTAGDTP